MTDQQIAKMVEELVGEIDYDYWKETYVPDYMPLEDQQQIQQALINIAKKYIND